MDKQEKIINIISETLGAEKDKITPASDLYKDLNAEKLEVVDILLKIQQVFDIEIEESKFNDVQTVNDLSLLVEEKSDEF